MSAPDDHQASVVLRAVRLCGVYKVHCAVAHRGLQRGAAAMEALPQAFREAVRGHAVASRIFDTRWAALRAWRRRALWIICTVVGWSIPLHACIALGAALILARRAHRPVPLVSPAVVPRVPQVRRVAHWRPPRRCIGRRPGRFCPSSILQASVVTPCFGDMLGNAFALNDPNRTRTPI